MDTCPRPITTTDVEKLKTIFGSDYDFLVKSIDELTKQCPKISQKGAKKKRKGSKSKKRRQKGGNIISAQIFKYISYAIFTSISAYLVATDNAGIKTILIGLEAVYSGTCGSLSNQIFGAIGYGNPICASYNNIMQLVTRSIMMDPIAITGLTSIVTLVLKSPFLFKSGIKLITYQMAKVLPDQILSASEKNVLYQEAVGARPEIENVANPRQLENINNIIQPSQDSGLARTSSIEDAASGLLSLKNSNTSYGGKKKKTKKTKKTKKSKKRRTRKY